jgi:hypothetical protein
MEDMRAYYAEPDEQKRNEIAARQLHILNGYLPRQAPAPHRLCVPTRIKIKPEMKKREYIYAGLSRGPGSSSRPQTLTTD